MALEASAGLLTTFEITGGTPQKTPQTCVTPWGNPKKSATIPGR